jgi:hypothetical protein
MTPDQPLVPNGSSKEPLEPSLEPVSEDGVALAGDAGGAGGAGGTAGAAAVPVVAQQAAQKWQNKAGVSMYRELLEMAMADGKLDPGEATRLAAAREKYGISEEEHAALLGEASVHGMYLVLLFLLLLLLLLLLLIL